MAEKRVLFCRTKWFLSLLLIYSFSEGDCELTEFSDTFATGGEAVSVATTRQQCEDHCLSYVS